MALRQQNTIDVLKTLSLLEQPGTNRPYWLVLVADQASYFSHAPAVLSTNRVARTNAPAGPALAPPGPAMDVTRTAYASTNVAAAKPGLIAELCIPGDAEATRRMLSDVVSGLKQQPFLSKVDLVSEDLRRGLADPKVTISDRFYAIALDFAETDLQQPSRTRRSAYPRHETPQKGPAGGGNGSGGKGFSRTGSAQN